MSPVSANFIHAQAQLTQLEYSQSIPLPRSLPLWLTMLLLGVYANLPCDMVLNGGPIVMSRTRFSLRR